MNKKLSFSASAVKVAFLFTMINLQSFASTTVTGTAEQGLLWTFIGIFAVGLALNLTPCVYPMLTITVSILGKDTGNSPGKSFLRALAYVSGMAVMYSALGVTAALTGGLFGGLLQSPLMLITIGAVFLILSLSMFGLFELQPPSFILNKIGNRPGAGLAGLFASGLFVGVFAAPCVGPPVIGLLTMVGHSGDPIYGLAVFLTLSAGLGFPYLILGTFTGLLSRLPRSGSWMIWVKKLMGFALAATGAFYISLGTNPGLALPLISLTMLLAGIYLGITEESGESKLFTGFKRVVALTMIVAALALFMIGRKQSVTWQNYSASEVQKISGRPSVIYFSASWCIPCLELDRRTLTHPVVIKTLEEFDKFKVDLSQYESPESQTLRQKYSIAGVPTLVFLDKDGKEIKSERAVGFIDIPGMMTKLENVLRGNSIAAAEIRAEESIEEPSIISMHADVKAISPGKPFRLGILFEMKPDWYVYWRNPGDSGTEPIIDWKLPAGFSAGPLHWPAPQRFSTPPFATFGHKNKAMIYAEITPPENLSEFSEFDFAADVSWLVCKDICVGQEGSVSLKIIKEEDSASASAALSESSPFDLTFSQQPMIPENWKFSAEQKENIFRLYIQPPSAAQMELLHASEFFPLQTGLVRAGSIKWEKSENRHFVVMTGTGIKPEETLEGLLILPESYNGNRYLKVKAEYSDKK